MTPKEYREKVENEVMNLLEICKPMLSVDEPKWIKEYLEHNEWGLAADAILEYIADYKISEADPRVGQLAKELQDTLNMAVQYKDVAFRDFF